MADTTNNKPVVIDPETSSSNTSKRKRSLDDEASSAKQLKIQSHNQPRPPRRLYITTNLPTIHLLSIYKALPLVRQLEAHRTLLLGRNLIPRSSISTLTLLLGDHSTVFFEQLYEETTYHGRETIKLLTKDEDDRKLLFPDERFTEMNSLLFESLDVDTALEIGQTFSGITNLQVISWRISPPTMVALVRLLVHWKYQIVSFKLIERLAITSASSKELWPVVNSMPVLKALSFDLHHLEMPEDLPIVSTLNELHFNTLEPSTKRFVQILRKHGTSNTSLHTIGHRSGDFGDIVLPHLLTLPEHLQSRITHFHFFRPIHNLAIESAHFRSLLTLEVSSCFDLNTFTYLTQLHQLLHLRLLIDLDKVSKKKFEVQQPLPSVRALELKLFVSSHHQLDHLNIATTLPNVQVIDLSFLICTCTTCHIGSFFINDLQSDIPRARRCLCQMFTTLKRDCSQLRTIRHNREDDLGMATELIAESN